MKVFTEEMAAEMDDICDAADAAKESGEPNPHALSLNKRKAAFADDYRVDTSDQFKSTGADKSVYDAFGQIVKDQRLARGVKS